MTVTFDPTTLGPDAVLSNGNLTIADTGEATRTGVFATAGMAAGGKYYFEMAMVAASGHATGCGFAQKTFAAASGDFYDGFSGQALGIVVGFGVPAISEVDASPSLATPATGLGTITAGTIIGMAVDLVNNRAWFKVGTGPWNASGAATPATPATGIDIGSMAGATLYPLASVTVGGDTITGNFSAATTYAVPSGFSTLAGIAPAVMSSNMVFLSWSDDRGHSFGNPVGLSLGGVGAYLTSLRWNRLGLARDRVFQLEWSTPTNTALQGAWIETELAQS